MGIFDIFTGAAAQDAAGDINRYVNRGLGQLEGDFGQGRDALTKYYGAGIDPFLKNWQTGNAGVNTLGDALGLNGPEGNARAVAAFQNNPSYKFGLTQGQDAIAAQAAKGGMAASGNALLEATKFGNNYANQNWNSYISQLEPYLNFSNTAAGGVLSGYGGLGSALNSSYMGQGNAAYGANASIGNAYANADLAKQQASGNLWNAAGQGAKAIFSML